MIDDLIKSTKDSIAERLASPLTGSFVVAWCVWNYKFLVILFSSAGLTQTFNLIDKIAFSNPTDLLLKGAVYPLVSALLYVFVYPYPTRAVYEFTLLRQREKNLLRQKIENETPLTLEESRRIRTEFSLLERKYREVEDRLNSEIKTPNLIPLAPLQYELLRILEQSKGTETEEAIISKSSQPRVQTEFSIGELVRLGLIETGFDSEISERTYMFTHEGRRALLNDGRVPSPRT